MNDGSVFHINCTGSGKIVSSTLKLSWILLICITFIAITNKLLFAVSSYVFLKLLSTLQLNGHSIFMWITCLFIYFFSFFFVVCNTYYCNFSFVPCSFCQINYLIKVQLLVLPTPALWHKGIKMYIVLTEPYVHSSV